jgi:ferredoxin-NADP reductase/MOSC domain-containing protein YiiM/predicted pyridoxine 5'-phosphate oxidase superfamily flavin-nucleotide-binding protein
LSNNDSPFHRGEQTIQSRLGVRDRMERLGRRMIRDFMPEEHRELFAELPTLLVGTLDNEGRPWASVLAGQPGFLQATDAQTLSVTARPIFGDPLNKSLVEGANIGALGMEFHTRRRNRLNGKLSRVTKDGFDIQVSQSFGNCPKYIQAREIETGQSIQTIGERRLVGRGKVLSKDEAALIARSDTFFIASQFSEDDADWAHGVDLSHRGGPPGFVIVAHQTALLFPDYTGNSMYGTLGNIQLNPRCGLLFIDFETGDTLQLTGEAEILWEPHHALRFPGALRVVSFSVEETRFIQAALPLTWVFQDYSPVFDQFESNRIIPSEGEMPGSMSLLSVNLSTPKTISHAGKAVTTGIFKQATSERVMLRNLNLDGDGQADLWGHGGAFRAVYLYSRENYEFWEQELGRDDFAPGQFGENFTVKGMLDDEVQVGDVFRVGDALIEVTQPRIPCYKLAIKMGIEGFQNRFMQSGRVGFYCRVLEEGEVGAGDPIERVSRDPQGLSVRKINDLLFFDQQDLDATRKALSIPALSHGWKGSFQERLTKAEEAGKTSEGFHTFVVARKVPESKSITSFYLEPEDGMDLAEFLPGQFLTFKLNIPGQSKPVIRTYSLSDSPQTGYYRVSIKRELPPADQPDVQPGLSSNYFHDQVEPGTKLAVGSPRGKFHLDPESKRAVVLLSAGVGMTPMISMLGSIVQTGKQQATWFIHGTQNSREHAMGELVRRMAEENDNVHAHISYSRPEPGDSQGRDYDSHGRIDISLLKRVLPFDDYEFYLCGPSPFMKSLNCELLSMGVSQSRIHYEFFGPATVLTDQLAPSGPAVTRTGEQELRGEMAVNFSQSGMTVNWDPACESILELAEKHGLSPDYSCRSGICHTCACKLVKGAIAYPEEPLDAPAAGEVLICCAVPKGPVEIEL